MNPTSPEYHQLIAYMKELRLFFHKTYGTHFKLGQVYQGNPEFSYFSLTTEALQASKLKFVIVLNHNKLQFNICLSGQNKAVRKQYWTFFKAKETLNYHLAASIQNSLSILDHTIVEVPNFSDKTKLTETIRKESLKFMDEINGLLN